MMTRKKKPKRKLISQPQIDDEKTESKDTSQFRVVSHAPKSNLENICDNVRDNADLTKLRNIEFKKLSREDQNMVEESVYAMMEKIKNTPIELDNTMPKELYTIVENKWHYYLKVEKEIRETRLAQVILELTMGQITKAFSILQNNIKDAIKKSTVMQKLIYGLTTVKPGEEDPFEGKNDGEDEDDDKEEEIEKEKEDTTMEETQQKKDEMAMVDEQQT